MRIRPIVLHELRSRRSIVASAVLLVALPLAAQLRSIKDFKIFDLYEQHELRDGRSSQLKSLLTAGQAIPNLDGTADLVKMHLETYDPEGQTNIIAAAPNCIVDTKRRTAGSSGPLEARTGDGRFIIQGQGFLCHMTNAHILITNGVRTFIRKDAASGVSQNP
jgi:hypothetical protein